MRAARKKRYQYKSSPIRLLSSNGDLSASFLAQRRLESPLVNSHLEAEPMVENVEQTLTEPAAEATAAAAANMTATSSNRIALVRESIVTNHAQLRSQQFMSGEPSIPLSAHKKAALPDDLYDDVGYDYSQYEDATTFEDSDDYKRAVLDQVSEQDEGDDECKTSKCVACRESFVVNGESRKHLCYKCYREKKGIWKDDAKRRARQSIQNKVAKQRGTSPAAAAAVFGVAEEKEGDAAQQQDNDFDKFYDQDSKMTSTKYDVQKWSTKSPWLDVKEYMENVTALYRARQANVPVGVVLEFFPDDPDDDVDDVHDHNHSSTRNAWMKEIDDDEILATLWFKETYDHTDQQWHCAPWNLYEEQALAHYRRATGNPSATYSEVVYDDKRGPIGWHHYMDEPRTSSTARYLALGGGGSGERSDNAMYDLRESWERGDMEEEEEERRRRINSSRSRSRSRSSSSSSSSSSRPEKRGCVV